MTIDQKTRQLFFFFFLSNQQNFYSFTKNQFSFLAFCIWKLLKNSNKCWKNYRNKFKRSFLCKPWICERLCRFILDQVKTTTKANWSFYRRNESFQTYFWKCYSILTDVWLLHQALKWVFICMLNILKFWDLDSYTQIE